MPAAPWPVEVAGVSEQAIMASHVLRYHYPQAEFPYADLTAENGRRGQHDPEHELLDTGILDCRPTRAGGAT